MAVPLAAMQPVGLLASSRMTREARSVRGVSGVVKLLFQILGDAESSSAFEDPDLPVAGMAEESPHAARVVAMVDVAGVDRETLATAAEGAATALAVPEREIGLRAEPVMNPERVNTRDGGDPEGAGRGGESHRRRPFRGDGPGRSALSGRTVVSRQRRLEEARRFEPLSRPQAGSTAVSKPFPPGSICSFFGLEDRGSCKGSSWSNLCIHAPSEGDTQDGDSVPSVSRRAPNQTLRSPDAPPLDPSQARHDPCIQAESGGVRSALFGVP